MNRNASALWEGNLHEGEGSFTTESGVLSKTQYSFRTRFAEGRGTNPDELIAASLGGCFSMALSNELGLCGFQPQRWKIYPRAGPSRTSSSTSMRTFRTPLKRVSWMRRSRQKQTVPSPACLKQISQ